LFIPSLLPSIISFRIVETAIDDSVIVAAVRLILMTLLLVKTTNGMSSQFVSQHLCSGSTWQLNSCVSVGCNRKKNVFPQLFLIREDLI
jgi:hypothetical protein